MIVATKITVDQSTGEILVDGERKTTIFAYTGQDLRLDVAIEDSSIVGIDNAIWVTLDANDRDLKWVSDGTSSFALPATSSLLGEPLGSEAGLEPRKGGRLIMDMAPAAVGDYRGSTITPYTGELDGVFSNVAIASGAVSMRAPLDFGIEPRNEQRGVVVRLAAHVAQPYGTVLRVKHRVPEWVSDNGQRNGSITIKPHAGERFKTAYLNTTDYSATPVKIVVLTEPSAQIAPVIKSRLPSAIAEHGDGIVQLLTDFFDYVCQAEGPLGRINHLDELRDPDKAPERFLDLLVAERASFLPRTAIADRKLVLKHAVRFFEHRGNAPSWSFLSRVIFGVECEIEHLQERVFRGSSGDWRQYTSVKGVSIKQSFTVRPDLKRSIKKALGRSDDADDSFGDEKLLTNLAGTRIRGYESRAEAIVEQAIQTDYDGIVVTEFTLSSVLGKFKSDEMVSPVDGLDLSGFPVNLRSVSDFSFLVVDQVAGLEIARDPDQVVGGSSVSFDPPRASALVLKSGGFEIADTGWSSKNPPRASVLTVDGDEVNVVVKVDSAVELPGEWVGGPGFASNPHYKTQDGWRHQLYAYEIHTPVGETEHKQFLKPQLHPAGHQMFSDLLEDATVAAFSPESRNKYTILNPGQRALHVGDLTGMSLSVYVNGRALGQEEWDVVGSGARTFIRFSDDVDVSSTRQALVSLRSVERASDLYPLNETVETILRSGVLKATTNSTEPNPAFFGPQIGRVIRGQLENLDDPTLWYQYIKHNTVLDDTARSASIGTEWHDVVSDVRGTTVVSYVSSDSICLAIAFDSFFDATNFSYSLDRARRTTL